MPRLDHRRTRARTLAAALLAGVAVLACEDPLTPTAPRSNQVLGFTVWALSGTPDEYPTALRVPQATLVRPDPSGAFDLAFDLDVDDKLVVLPVRSVIQTISQSTDVQFLRLTAAFEQVTEAPRVGYTADSAFVVDVGETFLVRVIGAFCQFDFRHEIYAKFEVESIIPAERRARLRGKLNPNCGFRSFADGTPEF